jgi:UDP-N-acetyl-D-glucosamine dehydrogenase
MGPETLVILESTTYPGTTREVVLPLLEAGGRKCGRDFFLAYSPERVDPGNATFTVENTDKLVGGIDEASGRRALDFYRAVIGAPVHLVASAEVAESAKMLENVFRNVNIALINELSLVFDRLGVNTWDVVKAATSKPYGFMPFYPGPGVGGHCIPVDPLYLSYRAHQVGVPARFIELGHQVNSQMPIHAVGLAERAFWQLRGTYLQGAPVGVLGLAYKRDIPDTRESPSIQIVRELVERGAQVTIHDPFAATPHEIEGKARRVKGWREVLEAVDVAIFVVDHTEYRAIPAATLRAYLRDHFIIDCRNLFPQSNPRILGIGRGRPTAKESRGLPT